MSLQHSQTRHIGRAGWFAVGVLAATLAFVVLIVAGDYYEAVSKESPARADMPAVIIEAN